MRGGCLIFMAFLVGQTGCESPVDGLNCPDVVLPAFEISVFDASTSEPIQEPLVWTRTGVRTDTLDVAENRAFGPWGVSGTFDISVTHAGYSDWFQGGVVVENGLCGPNTVFLDVFLQS